MISVIIPVYNGGKYIDGLFRNLRAQRETAEGFELVFIDDGSTDDSFARLSAAEGGANFTVAAYRQENAGVSAARNAPAEYPARSMLTQLKSERLSSGQSVRRTASTECALR